MDHKLIKFTLVVAAIVGAIVGLLAAGWTYFVTPRPCVQITTYGYDSSRCGREDQCREYTDEPRVACYSSVAAKRKDLRVCNNLLLIRERNICRRQASEIYP